MPATAVIAAHCNGYCGRTSATMRTARSRSLSGYLLTRSITSRSSQHRESPDSPRRITEPVLNFGRAIGEHLRAAPVESAVTMRGEPAERVIVAASSTAGGSSPAITMTCALWARGCIGTLRLSVRST